LLAFLGVIVSITLGYTGNLHLQISRLSKQLNINLDRERRAVRRSAYLLIGILLCAIVLVTLKPVLATTERETAFANAFGLYLIIWAAAVMYDLIRATFAVDR